ncbi:MAG: hypothetical protein AB7J30_12995 [Hyphomicrobium sp.]|uniref:hypothetical protein n=1 Tax=Hyphomicrobium sp. TaxID=82 RepID=UPI003D1072AC
MREMVNLILVAMAVVGAFLIAAPHFLLPGIWGELSADFGIAFLISGMLGLTVEKYTKTRFAKEIANDVFRSTMTYLLPVEFQNEMRWIYEQKIICRNHLQQVRIARHCEGYVRFSCRMERHLENVSNAPVSITLGLGVDEWFADTPSEITAFGYRVDGSERCEIAPEGGGRRQMKHGRPLIKAEEETIELGMGKTVVVWVSYSEIKPINSDHHSHFTYATKNPRVTIEADDGIAAVATFPRETNANKVQMMVDSYAYNGLVLPSQEIRIRWWEEARRLTWISHGASAMADNPSAV